MNRDQSKLSLSGDVIPLVTGCWAGPGVLRMSGRERAFGRLEAATINQLVGK